jgi:predicted MFS family arabinose efflux permease
VRLIDRAGYRKVLVGNTVALGLAIAAFGLIDAQTPHALTLLLLGGFGVVNSLQFTAMNTLTLGDLEGAHASSGNGLLSVVMQLSMSLGVAAGGALLAAFSGGHGQTPARGLVQAFHLTYFCVGAMSVAAAAVFLQLGRKEAPRGAPEVADDS